MTITRRHILQGGAAAAIGGAFGVSTSLPLAKAAKAQTAPAAPAFRHALSLFGDIKYPADFKRFDYVNPDAPRGGLVRQSVAGTFDSFNVVVADANGGFFLSGLETGHPVAVRLETGVTMITSGEPNDLSLPRIARHLPLFRRTDPSGWAKLLADNGELATSALNILPAGGFGTVCASLITLPHDGAEAWLFAAGPPDIAAFLPVETPR